MIFDFTKEPGRAVFVELREKRVDAKEPIPAGSPEAQPSDKAKRSASSKRIASAEKEAA